MCDVTGLKIETQMQTSMRLYKLFTHNQKQNSTLNSYNTTQFPLHLSIPQSTIRYEITLTIIMMALQVLQLSKAVLEILIRKLCS